MVVGLSLLVSAVIAVGADSARASAPADSTRASSAPPVAGAAAPKADEIAETRRMLAAQLAGKAVAAAGPTKAVPRLRLAGGIRAADALPVVRTNRLLAASPAVARSLVPPAPSFRRKINGRLIADSILVEKGRRKLTLFYRGDSVAVYLVALGKNPIGTKVEQGDNRTPEGVYHVEARNEQSEFHRALRISYPSAADRARAAQLGKDPGGDIMIHGLPKPFALAGDEHRLYDWTKGCIALTNAEIEEIYAAVVDGAVVNIRP